MKTHIVYLHIEKAAGSSQRKYFFDVIGKDNIYWYKKPINNEQKNSIYDFFLIGGHTTYLFYDNKDLIYTTVLRNPVQRILSFYNYCKEVIPNSWTPLGLDVHSLKNTIKFCEKFRHTINNAQCRYISGSERFDNTINIIFKKSFLIGSLENINTFNSHIAKNLELYYKELPLDNVGKQGYINNLELDEECLVEIEKLISEDIKLYNFISRDCKGLYSSVSNTQWSLAKNTLRSLRNNSKLPLLPKDFIREQAIRSAGFVLLTANFDEQTIVRHGQTFSFWLEFSIAREMKTLEIGIHIFDSFNRKVFDTNSTMLGKALTDIKCGTHQIRYFVIAELPEGQYTAGFTFTECQANEYYEIKRYDHVVNFSVTVSRTTPSTGYVSLPCGFDYLQTSDVIVNVVENAAGTAVADKIIGEVNPSEIFTLPVRLKNNSAQVWVSMRSHPISLSYHWLDQAGNMVVSEGIRTPLPVREVMKGQTLIISMKVIAPDVSGRYKLIFLPVQENHCWFDKRGFTPGMLELEVVEACVEKYYTGTGTRPLS